MSPIPVAQAEGAVAKPISVSFEFFPPKTPEMEESLWRNLQRLAPLAPSFVSVTYGAGGTTRERTHATVERILRETSLAPAAHLTCVGASRAEIDQVADDYWRAGVRHIVALRGDPPEGQGSFVPHPEGHASSTELVAALTARHTFQISVGCYPEMHPDSSSRATELGFLKRKIDAGASRAISQFFFDPDVFLRFRDEVAGAGVNVPVIPGILPVTNFRQVQKFAAQCGASVPAWLARLFDGLDNDPETRKLVAATVAAEQCRRLSDAGVTQFHFYTLNRADLTFAICHILGVRPAS